jgi:hypothetical protein
MIDDFTEKPARFWIGVVVVRRQHDPRIARDQICACDESLLESS